MGFATFASADPITYLTADDMYEGLRFGSEMTISNQELFESYPSDYVKVHTPLANEYVAQMRLAIIARYAGSPLAPDIVVKTSHSKWTRGAFALNYPNGFQLTIFPDPGVLELNSKPSSIDEIEKNLTLIQTDFFDQGKEIGLEPASFTGSGHIHIEVSKVHPVTVRNFLADFYNSTGLAVGALNEDVFNAIGAGEFPEANKQELRNSFKNFDSESNRSLADLENLASAAYQIPYSEDLPEFQKSRYGSRDDKSFAVSFLSLRSVGTLEIRSIRPQASAASYLKLTKLFAARMHLAEEKRIRGELVPIGELKSLRGNPQAIIADFDRYVSEAGLDIKDYREFVMPWWQNTGGEFDKYLDAKSKKNVPKRLKRTCSKTISE
ncbi:MAG: hypothetical protein V4692_05735 [Bdellovibrionota bacterium]